MDRMPTRWRQWLGCGGCIVVLAALFAFLVSIARVLGPLLFALVLSAIGLFWWRVVQARQRAITAFRAANRTTGKDMLVMQLALGRGPRHLRRQWTVRVAGHRVRPRHAPHARDVGGPGA